MIGNGNEINDIFLVISLCFINGLILFISGCLSAFSDWISICFLTKSFFLNKWKANLTQYSQQ